MHETRFKSADRVTCPFLRLPVTFQITAVKSETSFQRAGTAGCIRLELRLADTVPYNLVLAYFSFFSKIVSLNSTYFGIRYRNPSLNLYLQNDYAIIGKNTVDKMINYIKIMLKSLAI